MVAGSHDFENHEDDSNYAPSKCPEKAKANIVGPTFYPSRVDDALGVHDKSHSIHKEDNESRRVNDESHVLGSQILQNQCDSPDSVLESQNELLSFHLGTEVNDDSEERENSFQRISPTKDQPKRSVEGVIRNGSFVSEDEGEEMSSSNESEGATNLCSKDDECKERTTAKSSDIEFRFAPQRPMLQRSNKRNKLASRDITQAIRTATTIKLIDLIKNLYEASETVVVASLIQLHSLIDEDAMDETLEPDNTLELGVIRRGGHLALMRALQRHTGHAVIQAMGWAALAWICERTNVKSAMVTQGALPLALATLQRYGITESANWSVVTEVLYLVGHLSTIPKVAQQTRFRETALWEELVPRLKFAYKEGQNQDAESAVDAFLFCSLQWAKHRSTEIVHSVWQAGSLRFVVCLLQDALVFWQAAYEPEIKDACQVYEDRLVIGCRILTHWASTPTPAFVHALIEAGALTVAAEVLRLFPAGTVLRRAANPCLRAMVPATED